LRRTSNEMIRIVNGEIIHENKKPSSRVNKPNSTPFPVPSSWAYSNQNSQQYQYEYSQDSDPHRNVSSSSAENGWNPTTSTNGVRGVMSMLDDEYLIFGYSVALKYLLLASIGILFLFGMNGLLLLGLLFFLGSRNSANSFTSSPNPRPTIGVQNGARNRRFTGERESRTNSGNALFSFFSSLFTSPADGANNDNQ